MCCRGVETPSARRHTARVPVFRRYAQYAVDKAVLVAATLAVFAGTDVVFESSWPQWLVVVPLELAGDMWMQVWFPHRNGGATPGMRLLGLRIVTQEGKTPDLRGYVVRWLLFTVDGLFSGVLGAILIAVTEKRQRLGDIVARTLVVRIS
jgi:uncharacterized RDD family membrane protein YckC